MIIETVLLEHFGICERMMAKICKEPLEATRELYVEEFFQQVRAKKTESQIKFEESTEVKKFHGALTFLLELLTSKYVRLLEIRSDKMRGVVETFQNRLTFFMHKTGLYSQSKLRETYLLLCYDRFNLSSLVSHSNMQTSKLWNLPKSVLLGIQRANFDFQLDIAKDNLRAYVPINNYCAYSKWLRVDRLRFPEEVQKNYDLTNYGHNPDRFFWIYSNELCEFMFNKFITNFYTQTMLFLQHFESSDMFDDITELLAGSWLKASSDDILNFLLTPILNILTKFNDSEEYANKIALYVDIILNTCMLSYVITSEEIVINLLKIGREIMKHGTYAICFPTYYKIIKRIIGWTSLPRNQKIDHIDKLVDQYNEMTDVQTTLIDLLEFTARIMVLYRSWDVEFRSKLVRYVIMHCNSKDINKRIVYMSIVAFLNRVLRTTDYAFKEVAISHNAFINQNGYVDMFMLKEAFREIRANINYSKDETMLFNEEQFKELKKIDEDCIPSVVFPQFLTLPFKALKLSSTEGETCKFFNENMMKMEEIEKYTKCFTDFVRQLIQEFSEEIDESTLYVDYDFPEILIDTKKLYKFDKDLLIFACMKIFCMFLGLSPAKVVCSKIESVKHRPQDSDLNLAKVKLSFYCALVGASGYFKEEEFNQVLEMGRPILAPFFTAANCKYLESFMGHFYKAIRGNLTYKRLKLFLHMIIDMMQSDAPDHHVYYLEFFIFQIKICQMLVTDQFLDVFKRLMETVDFTSSITAASISSRLFREVNSVRLLLSFTDEFIIKSKRMVTEDTLSTHLFNKDVINFDDYVKAFLKKVRDNFDGNPWMKIEGIRHIVYMVFDKKITSHNLSTCKKIAQILFRMKPKDFNDVNVVTSYKNLILNMRENTIIQRHIKEQLLEILFECWNEAEATECYKGILMMYRIGYNNNISEIVHKFLMAITKVHKLGIQDDIFIFIRDDLFSRLSDRQLYEYSQRLIKLVNSEVAHM